MRAAFHERVEIECRAMRDDFAALLRRAPARFFDVAENLVGKIQFNRATIIHGWPAQFTPMVGLYPYLQSEALEMVDEDALRLIGLGHLLLLIHSVIEDRQLDQQIGFDPEELLLSKFLLHEGLRLMRTTLGSRAVEFDQWTETLMKRYISSQMGKKRCLGLGKACVGSVGETESLAAGRASLGALGAMAIGLKASRSTAKIQVLLEAFDFVAIGLQWADDEADWSEDLRNGQENLLLRLMRADGIDIPLRCSMRIKRAWIGNKVTADWRILALGRGCENLRHAVAAQRALGAPTLADNIRSVIERIEKKIVALDSARFRPLFSPRNRGNSGIPRSTPTGTLS